MANAYGRGLIRIKDFGTYDALKKLYVKKGTDWRDAKTAWVKQNGEWIQVYPTPVAEISIDPPTLNFEAANGYESPTQFVNITNNGTEDLIIEDFTTSYTVGGKFVTFFDLTDLGGVLPATIAPGETKRLGIAIDAGSGAAFVQQDYVVIVDTPTLKTVNILCPLTSIDVDYLVVAGGGGGGSGVATASGTAGGGGGGGVVSGTKRPIPRGQSIPIRVGQGGAGLKGSAGAGADGQNSSFGDIVAIGGGGGGGGGSAGIQNTGLGRLGGSGGGAGLVISNYSLYTITLGLAGGTPGVYTRVSNGGSGTPGQGYPGASSSPGRLVSQVFSNFTYDQGAPGGGGGAGGAGTVYNGGPGRGSKITGIGRYYGGGGAASGGVGGAGGGGDSNGPNIGGVRVGGGPGAPNTGGGGGGMIGSNMVRTGGGDGGSGIVIVKYDYDIQLGEGGTVTSYTTDDGVKHWVHTFTQDGTFTYKEVFETKQITVVEQVATTTQQLVQTNAGELGSSDSKIRIKTNIGAFGTRYVDYTIYGNVVPQYAEIDILPANDITMHYYRYNPRPARQEIIVTNIGTGSLIITGVSCVTQYFKIIAFPDAVAPQMTGIIIIEAGATEQTEPGSYTDVITIKSNDIKGDNLINMTLEVRFPAGNARISTSGIGYWTVPEGVYRLSEVRVIGAGGGGGQGFNQQDIPPIPNPNPSIVVDYLIVGAGGAGGTSGAGGGGGGVLTGAKTISQGSPMSVVVGASSTSGLLFGGFRGFRGGSSSFAGVIAQGGGHGGGVSGGFSFGSTNFFNSDGGSGGGGAGGYPGTVGQGTPGQGYPGGGGGTLGLGVPGTAGDGGGGGAGGPGGGAYGGGQGQGFYASGINGGNGGPGIASSITGTTKYYGGGGAGRGGIDGVGGSGGGGNAGQPGAPNTGGGGGGGTPATQVRNGLSISNNPGTPGGAGGSGVVIVRYQADKQICQGGDVTSFTADGLTYWVHTFTASSTFLYKGVDPILSGGVNAAPIIIPGAGAGGGGGSGSIMYVANVEVIAGDKIEYVVGRGGAGIGPVFSTTNPAPSGQPGQGTSFYNNLISAAGGLGGGGGGPNTGGVGASNTPNPLIHGISLVPRTLSYAWSGHMNTYAVWDNPSDAGNSWYTFRKFIPTAAGNYTFYLSCDNYGVLYLNGTVILSTTSFSSVTSTTVELTKDKINIIGMYAQNWGGPCGYALHITNSAGQVVWDTRTYRAPEVIESLPGAVSRAGGVGQNGSAGIGNGGHGGSNTFGLGGTPGLYDAPPPAGSVYFSNHSALISGNNSNLVVPGDFTVECWIKQTGRPNTWNGVFEIGQWPNYPILLRCYGVDLDFWYGPGVGQIYPYVNINQWHHIAISRSGSLMRVYVDGVARLSASYGGTLNPGGAPITIGSGTHERSRTGFTGYISNFRFVNGTALYTDTFTPPREVLTAVPGTVVLACQTNDTTLNSTGIVPLSKYNSPINSDEMPFFVPNKPVTLSAGGPGRGPGTGGGGGASGVDGQFTPASGPGADGEIYISWGPIPPRDPPPNLVAHFVVNIEEQRMYDRVLPYCNPYSMVTSGYFTEKGRNYVLFNGTSNNYIGTPADPKYDLVRATNLSFTIEAWVILKGTGSAGVWGGEIINRDAEYEVAINGNDQVIVAIDWGVGTDVNLPGSGWIIPTAGKAVVPRNVPTHVAVVADQTTLYIYLNGKLEYTTGLNRVARRDNTPVWIGNRPGQNQAFNGAIADVRIWNVARTQAQIQTFMQALIYNTPQGI